MPFSCVNCRWVHLTITLILMRMVMSGVMSNDDIAKRLSASSACVPMVLTHYSYQYNRRALIFHVRIHDDANMLVCIVLHFVGMKPIQ